MGVCSGEEGEDTLGWENSGAERDVASLRNSKNSGSRGHIGNKAQKMV